MPLPQFQSFNAVWTEKTKAAHGHGGPGWEFGTCLWSPTKDKTGKKIYQNIPTTNDGDLVLHFYEDTPFGKAEDHYFFGIAIVDGHCKTVSAAPPKPGDWVHAQPQYSGQYTASNRRMN